MKKLAFFLAAFFTSSTVLATLPNGIDDFQVNVPLFKGGFEFGFTALYLKATAPQLDYAVDFDSDNFQGGRLRDVEPKFKFGYQAYLGYQIPCSRNDILLTYTQFDEKDSEHVAVSAPGFIASELAPTTLDLPLITATLQLDGTIEPVVTLFPLTEVPVDFTISQASASDTFRQNVVDLDFGQWINLDNYAKARIFMGLRNAKVRHHLNVSVIYNTLVTEENTVFVPALETSVTAVATFVGDQLGQILKESSHFDGLGPRLGMEGTFYLNGGFGLKASLSGALLVGSVDSAVSEEFEGTLNFTLLDVSAVAEDGTPVTITNLNPPPINTVIPAAGNLSGTLISSPDQTRMVPNFEAKIALNYTYSLKYCQRVDIDFGYYINHYFNAVDRRSLFDARNVTMDADFEGPYLSVSVCL